MLFISNFQSKTTEESQKKLSLEMQNIRDEMGRWKPRVSGPSKPWQSDSEPMNNSTTMKQKQLN